MKKSLRIGAIVATATVATLTLALCGFAGSSGGGGTFGDADKITVDTPANLAGAGSTNRNPALNYEIVPIPTKDGSALTLGVADHLMAFKNDGSEKEAITKFFDYYVLPEHQRPMVGHRRLSTHQVPGDR